MTEKESAGKLTVAQAELGCSQLSENGQNKKRMQLAEVSRQRQRLKWEVDSLTLYFGEVTEAFRAAFIEAEY